jgi:hypothetical protein
MNLRFTELFTAYGVTAFAMLVGLLLMRAGGRAYWRWPVYSVMAMVLGLVAWFLLRKHLLPPEWAVTRGALLYYSALATYAAVGFSLGLLLGRLTRGKTPESDT